MIERMRNKAGFTLAELMMSIAIVLILAAIALPSIFTAQNNMRMVELNNAAQSIANAAQAQMTSMKVSGTWLPVINNDDGTVKYPVAKNAPGTDTFYMIASNADGLQGARDNGVLPSLSIDDTVRNGDFVIVFKASTASVIEVFYADGKSGFFGDAPASTTAAQNYYESSAASTDQTVRMKNDPMIGYYQGTPAGATPAVALKNPVIWVDKDDGVLCIRHENINKGLSANVTVSIAKKDDTSQFKLTGLDETFGTAITVEWGANEALLLSGGGVLSTDPGKTTYRIDLNKLVDAVSNQKDSAEKTSLLSLLESYQVLESTRVNATVESSLPSVPASAQAYIEWPKSPAKLRILVTNPHIDDKKSTSGADGAYSKPEDAITLINGALKEKVNPKADGYGDATPDDKNIYELKGTVDALSDTEASRQSYSGQWVNLDDPGVNLSSSAADDKETTPIIEVQPGSFTSKNGSTHTYQVAEIWLNDTLVGSYDSSGNWTWNQGEQPSFLVLVSDDPNAPCDAFFNPVTRVQASAQALRTYRDEGNGISPDEDGGYVLYVRSMPKISEVQDYFAKNAGEIERAISDGGTWSDAYARSADVPSMALQDLFEREFGIPSSSVLWSAALKNARPDSGFGYDNSGTDVFAYYAICPFKPQNDDGSMTRNDTGPSILWRCNSTPSGLYSLMSGMLLAQDFRDPSYDGRMAGLRFEDRTVVNPARISVVESISGRADIAIPATVDYLYFRELYFYSDGKPVAHEGRPAYSWSPYFVCEGSSWDSDTGKLAEPQVSGPSGSASFIGWSLYEDARAPLFPNDKQLNELDSGVLNDFPFGTVDLHAAFKNKVGMLYVEYDEKGSVAGYSGCLNSLGDVNTLTNEGKVASWNYYVVVPKKDVDANNKLVPKARNARLQATGTIIIGDIEYYTYGISKLITDATKKATQEVTVETGSTKEVFYVNFNFAASITQSLEVKESWGTSSNPWIVRHALQFIGTLKAYHVQPNYMGGHFLQTHDIDLSDMYRVGMNPEQCKYTGAFTGSYDGGGYEIRSFYLMLQQYYVGDGGDEDRRGTGLFAQVKGTKDARASLKRIKLVADQNDSYELSKQGNASGFKASSTTVGLLVGSAYYCDIDSCSVVGNNAKISIKYATPTDGWGTLAGGLYDSTITNSSVEGITFMGDRYVSGENWGNTSTVTVGGLVGRIRNTVVSDCKVVETAVGSEKTLTAAKSKTSILACGGLVGAIYSGSVSNCTIDKSEILLPKDQATMKDVYKTCIGGVAGLKDPSVDIQSTTFGVTVSGEGYASESVEDPYWKDGK